jgi:hypothetical protein
MKNEKEAQAATVTIDDVEYVLDDLPPEVRHCLYQVQEVKEMIDTKSLDLQRHEMMQRGYITELRDQMLKITPK